MEITATREIPCRHCGRFFSPHGDEQFCCSGCKAVFDFAGTPTTLVETTKYRHLDEHLGVETHRARFFLGGLSCAACLQFLESLPDYCDDAKWARLNISQSVLEVERKPGGSFRKIAEALEKFGFEPNLLEEDHNFIVEQNRSNRTHLIRMGVAAACAGNIMLVAVCLYGGAEAYWGAVFRSLMFVFAVPSLTYCAWPFYKNAFAAIGQRRLNIDVPIVIALWAGTIWSVYAFLGGIDGLYFDSLATLVLLLLSTRFWLRRMQAHVDTALKRSSFGWNRKIQTGDTINFVSGDDLTVDGEVVTGMAQVDTALMNGESQPIVVKPGVVVEAGCRVLSGDIDVRALKVNEDTRLYQVLRQAEQVAHQRPQWVQFADQVGQVFVAVVLLMALGILIYWAPIKIEEGVTRALAFMIVTCPCVFGMAIPLSVSLAIKKAKDRGIFIRTGDVFERILQIRSVFFDKTGTLTSGQWQVRIVPTDDGPVERHHLAAALAIEAGEVHPFARALRVALHELNKEVPRATDMHRLIEGGVQGQVGDHFYRLIPAQEGAARGAGPMRGYFELFCDGHCVVRFEAQDEMRPESADVVEKLRAKGLSLQIVSGDQPHIVADCARTLGNISWIARATAEQKAATIRMGLPKRMMVGDGANDAIALAAADVSVAMQGGIEISLHSADVFLSRPRLDLILELQNIAAQTRSAIRRNLMFSTTFNLLSGSLAIAGYMTPLWAAILMPISSTIVLGTAWWSGVRK